TFDLQRRVKDGEVVTGRDILEPAFAVVFTAAQRVLAIDLYDVQLLSGLALARGTIAEMQTGEGKTFAALLPAYLHALAGDGVHVMTVNAYLAKRDFEQIAPVYRLLGLSVGLIEADIPPDAKRNAYASDITYGPGYEFGFDYLRDQVALISRCKPRLGDSFRARQGVRELGGLHVVATEPQESTRVDRQLFGRAARQGDPGSCQRFASSDDELFARYAPSLSARIQRLADTHGQCQMELEHDVAALQHRVEGTRAYQRRQLFAHDDWLESVLRDLT
ncbi:MAG: hypothetical protein QF918_13620, partial [Pirellulaceae bacterium]|nr:hypothetical protein [Pirellulaceae bacterium]